MRGTGNTIPSSTQGEAGKIAAECGLRGMSPRSHVVSFQCQGSPQDASTMQQRPSLSSLLNSASMAASCRNSPHSWAGAQHAQHAASPSTVTAHAGPSSGVV